MKVGVYLGSVVPEAGGAYTFQDDIFQYFLKLSKESRHSFIVFSSRPERLHQIPSLNHIELAPYRFGFFEKLINHLGKWVPAIHEIMKYHSRLKRIACSMDIKFMWFLSNVQIPIDVPYLCTVWDLQHRLQPWFPEVGSLKKWHACKSHYTDMLQRASVIIAGTQAGKEEIVRFYNIPPKNVRLLAHPTPRFAINGPYCDCQDNVLDKYNIPSGYLFYPAQFWPHKNHAGLLAAVHILREKYGLNLPVVFVGDDKGNKDYIKLLASQFDLSDQVYYLGFVPQDDLVGLYRNAFVLIYLTFFGPENLPPLEAFALGCPVIASAVPGAEEQLGKAAILVNPSDYEQIALEIKSLYESHEQRLILIQRGKERAARWTGRDFVRGIFKILDEFEPIRNAWGK